EQGLTTTRRLVEETRVRPRTDLLRIEALLEEARINLARSRAQRVAAWRQLAAEVGVSELSPPEEVRGPFASVPRWDPQQVLTRVLAANTALKQVEVDVERARLALERARAQAVPNITVGGGYNAENVDRTAGATL